MSLLPGSMQTIFEGGTLEEVLLRARDQIAETGDADAIQAYEILSDAVERYPGFGDTKILGQSWNQGDMFQLRDRCLCF